MIYLFSSFFFEPTSQFFEIKFVFSMQYALDMLFFIYSTNLCLLNGVFRLSTSIIITKKATFKYAKLLYAFYIFCNFYISLFLHYVFLLSRYFLVYHSDFLVFYFIFGLFPDDYPRNYILHLKTILLVLKPTQFQQNTNFFSLISSVNFSPPCVIFAIKTAV